MYQSTILVLRFSALGDVAMTMPAIYSVAKAHPEVRFVVATKPFFCRIFVNAPGNVEMLPIDLKQYKGMAGLFRLISLMHQQHPDAVADLHNVLRTWLIDFSFRLKGVRVVMLDKQRSKRKKSELAKPVRPFVTRYFDVFEQLGLAADPQVTSVYDSCTSPALPEFMPVKKGIRWIGLAPFARYISKSFPVSQGRELVERLNNIPNVQLFLFGGGEEEKKTLETWCNGIEGPIIMVGKMPVEQEISLMSQLDVMISMDSANMHLASIAGTRVVSLWGGTAPSCGFLGWGQRASDAMCAGLPCQPCTVAGSNQCKLNSFQCWSSITPDAVCQKIVSILNEDDKN